MSRLVVLLLLRECRTRRQKFHKINFFARSVRRRGSKTTILVNFGTAHLMVHARRPHRVALPQKNARKVAKVEIQPKPATFVTGCRTLYVTDWDAVGGVR